MTRVDTPKYAVPPQVPPLVALALIVILDRVAVARHLMLAEEQYLEAKFGEEWRDYRARVRRWI